MKAILGLLAWSWGSCFVARKPPAKPGGSVGVEHVLATARHVASGARQLPSGQAISDIWGVVALAGQRLLRYLRPIKARDLHGAVSVSIRLDGE